MPVIIHTRDAWPDTLDVLRTHWASRVCLASCTAYRQLRASPPMPRHGLLPGFWRRHHYPKAATVREAARIVPADRLLLETDAPYLAPVPYRGKRNEPAFVANRSRAGQRSQARY